MTDEEKIAVLKMAGITLVQDGDKSWGWITADKPEPDVYYNPKKYAIKEAMRLWRKRQEKQHD